MLPHPSAFCAGPWFVEPDHAPFFANHLRPCICQSSPALCKSPPRPSRTSLSLPSSSASWPTLGRLATPPSLLLLLLSTCLRMSIAPSLQAHCESAARRMRPSCLAEFNTLSRQSKYKQLIPHTDSYKLPNLEEFVSRRTSVLRITLVGNTQLNPGMRIQKHIFHILVINHSNPHLFPYCGQCQGAYAQNCLSALRCPVKSLGR